ncbi:MAG: heparinase II/III family protein [Armatimonadota bacterium]
MKKIFLVVLVMLATVSYCSAENFLDLYLNNIKLDQSNVLTMERPDQVLKGYDISSGQSLGQVFTTGADVTELTGVCVLTPHWVPSWCDNCDLILTVYDGPEKKEKLVESRMKKEWAGWEDFRMVFEFRIPAKPNTQYYFELTVDGNGQVGPIYVFPQNMTQEYGAYFNGQPINERLAFEIYVRKTFDRDKAYADQFALLNLDFPGMEKVKAAVEAKDWDNAAKALVEYFEAKHKTPKDEWLAVERDPNFNSAKADLAVQMKVEAEGGRIISLGPNWNHLRWWDTRGGVGLTRGGLRGVLAGAYFQTKDEKYAKAFVDMIKAVLINLPPPLKSGVIPEGAQNIQPVFRGGLSGGSMWAGLSAGARLGHAFAYYDSPAQSDHFTWDVKAAFIMNLVDMAEHISVLKGDGNWEAQIKTGMMETAEMFPEFKRSDDFFILGFEGVVKNMWDTLAPDGPTGESTGYQFMMHNRFLHLLRLADERNLKVDKELRNRVEKAFEFHMHMTQPDGYTPAFGDAGKDNNSASILKAADFFKRDDMRWVATNGEQGKIPNVTSIEFPYSKYYVMRSEWGPNGNFMALKNGRYSSHGHFDSLGFVLYAGENEIFVDPAVYIYGTPETRRLMSSANHNTITVDDRDLNNGGGLNQFFAGKNADLFIGVGPDYQGLSSHIYPVRRLAFVKPNYWVMSDIVRGDGEREAAVRFVFNNDKNTLDKSTNIARTTYTKGGNLAVIPVNANNISIVMEEGLSRYGHPDLAKVPILKQSVKKLLPSEFHNVLYSYNGDFASPNITNISLGANSGPEAFGVRIASGNKADLVLFTKDQSGRLACAEGNVSFVGQAAVVRLENNKLSNLTWMWGRNLYLKLSGNKLTDIVVSPVSIASLELMYNGNELVVNSSNAVSGLKIFAGGASTLRLNGKVQTNLKPVDGYFYPYGTQVANYIIIDNEFTGFNSTEGLVGGIAGGSTQMGFAYHWSHTSPGRAGKYIYDIPNGKYRVEAYVPKTKINVMAEAALYRLFINPNSTFIPAKVEGNIKSFEHNAAEGIIEIRVDQQSAADSWVNLGVYAFSNGKLEIQADNPTRGPVVVADALRLTISN